MLNKIVIRYILLLTIFNITLNADIYLKTSTKEINLSNNLKTFYTEEYSEEYKKELYELENLYAAEDLYDLLKINPTEYKQKLSILKKILKREAVLKYIKNLHTIANSRYLEFFNDNDLFLPKRYNIELLKYKDKKTAKRVFNLLNTGKTYKEVKIIISKISKIEEYNKNYIILKEIEDGKINNKLKTILLNINKPILINKLIEINKIYYIILINDIIEEFNKKAFINKLRVDSKYRDFINNAIVNQLFMKKIKETKTLYNYTIVID